MDFYCTENQLIVQKDNVIYMRVLNLEHDLCLATEEVNFIPPKSVVEFARRCRWLERFMRGPDGDKSAVVPWGWNLQLKERLLKEGVPEGELPTGEELEFIKENSRREVAVELLRYLKGHFEDWDNGGKIVPSVYRIVAHSLQEIEDFLQEKGKVVLKSPLSGSGKGIRFVTKELMETDRGWCMRILGSQGAVMVEERLDVVQEFAMLFEVSGCGIADGAGSKDAVAAVVAAGGVKFLGYSMFYASNGAYRRNLLASNEYIAEKLAQLPDMDASIVGRFLEETRKWIEIFLQERLGGKYAGFVGVDMFLYRDGEEIIMVNPAVEINLRMTMGLIARNIYDYHREEFLLGEGTHCFEPDRGIFPIEK